MAFIFSLAIGSRHSYRRIVNNPSLFVPLNCQGLLCHSVMDPVWDGPVPGLYSDIELLLKKPFKNLRSLNLRNILTFFLLSTSYIYKNCALNKYREKNLDLPPSFKRSEPNPKLCISRGYIYRIMISRFHSFFSILFYILYCNFPILLKKKNQL